MPPRAAALSPPPGCRPARTPSGNCPGPSTTSTTPPCCSAPSTGCGTASATCSASPPKAPRADRWASRSWLSSSSCSSSLSVSDSAPSAQSAPRVPRPCSPTGSAARPTTARPPHHTPGPTAGPRPSRSGCARWSAPWRSAHCSTPARAAQPTKPPARPPSISPSSPIGCAPLPAPFDEVSYAGRPADPADYALLRDLDDALLRTTPPPPASRTSAAPASHGWAVSPPRPPHPPRPLARHIWQRARGLLLAAALLAAAGVALAALRSAEHTAPLDPRSASPDGSEALARLLTHRGVHTTVLTDAAALRRESGPDTTLLVPFPDSLTERQRTAVRKAAEDSGRTVLLAPDARTTSALTPGVRTFAARPVQPTRPDCDLPAARRAGGADLGGRRYSSTARPTRRELLSAERPRHPLLRLHSPSHGDTVLLGTTDPLRNEHLDHHGNASLALQLLGPHPQLLWYLPSDSGAAPSDDQERSFFDLLPGGWSWAAVQLAVAALLAALWRAHDGWAHSSPNSSPSPYPRPRRLREDPASTGKPRTAATRPTPSGPCLPRPARPAGRGASPAGPRPRGPRPCPGRPSSSPPSITRTG